MRRLLALLLVCPACFVDEPPVEDDDAADEEAADEEDGSSSDESGASEEGSTGDVDICAAAYDECVAPEGADAGACFDEYRACDPAIDACAADVDLCTWNCCPYEPGAPGWDSNCGPDVENYDEIEACRDACGLYGDCLPTG